MNSIHQLLATHCTYGTSALERRQGETADRVLGYSVRASSLEGGTLASWYREIERLLYYYLPRDAPSDAKLQLTAVSAPKRLIYLRALDDLEMMAQVCYRPTDTAGRPGSYFAHCLVRQKNNGGDPWSALDGLKLWGAARWIEHDSAAIPHRVHGLSTLGELLDGRRPAIDERVVWTFLTAAEGGPFDDPGSVIPPRWRQKSPSQRRELFTAVLGDCLEIDAGRCKSVLLAAEPCVAALVWFGILRLLPRLADHPELGFSTFETDVDRRRFMLAATCFQKPDETDLPPELYKSGPALLAVNTYRHTRSQPPSNVTAAQAWVDTLVRGGWEAVDARNRPKAAKTTKKTVDPYYEWLGIPPKDQPPNHYRLLGLELFEENRNVIDTAANRQMSFIKEYQAGEDSELSQKLLNELAAARICLLTAEKKAAYDEDLRAAFTAREAPVVPARPAASSRWRTEPAPPAQEPAVEPPMQPPPSIPLRPPVTLNPVSPPALDSFPRASPVAALAAPPVAPSLDSGASPMIVEPSLPDPVGKRLGLLPRSKTKVGAIAVAAGVVGAVGITLLAYVLASALRPTKQTAEDAVANRTQQPAVGREQVEAPVAKPTTGEAPATVSPPPSVKTPAPTTPSDPVKSQPGTPVMAVPLATQTPPSSASPGQDRGSGQRPNLPNPQAAPSSPSPEHDRGSGQRPNLPRPVEAVPSSAAQPVVTPAVEPLEAPPATPTTPPTPTETLEQAEKRLKVAAAQASSPAEHKAVAREALAIADKAILDSQGEVAKRLVTLALTAARTAKLDEETKQATLLLIELAQPLTDAVKAKARQRLSERGDAGPAAAVPNTDGGSVKSQTPSSKSQTNPKHQIQNS